jgi:cob(I)alamin adenosyltransferase
MSVYTKTGDKGKTGTVGGKRVSKSSKLIQTIGSIDELNSYLGIIGKLTKIQRNLFTINSILSGADLKGSDLSRCTKELEKEIDEMEGKMPVLTRFIIYSGTSRATKIYYARALARKAERMLVGVSDKNHPNLVLIAYLNRLSDYLFTLARFINFKNKIKEEEWKS